MRIAAASLLVVVLPLLNAACARGQAAAGQAAPPPAPHEGAKRPVLVELFTSQGCSSCPPADRLLAKLAAAAPQDRTVIPLAFHVDYWNSLGWQDPFSAASWSRRQERYGTSWGGGHIYTPEAVIAGRVDCVGNDETKLRRLVASAAAEPVLATVAVERDGATPGSVRVTVRADRTRDAAAPAAEVLVALYENGLETPVRAGENAHRTLHNDRVVRRLQRALLLPAGGGAGAATVDLALEPGWKAGALGVVAFVQEPASLRVLAAAEASR
jgi:hypothetical protein